MDGSRPNTALNKSMAGQKIVITKNNKQATNAKEQNKKVAGKGPKSPTKSPKSPAKTPKSAGARKTGRGSGKKGRKKKRKPGVAASGKSDTEGETDGEGLSDVGEMMDNEVSMIIEHLSICFSKGDVKVTFTTSFLLDNPFLITLMNTLMLKTVNQTLILLNMDST